MSRHADILDARESLRSPLVKSLAFHGAVLALFSLWTVYTAHVENWGTPNPAPGNAVAVNAVHTLPLPNRAGRQNPVANDTENRAEQAPKQEVKKRERVPEPDAIPLRSREAPHKPSREQTSPQKYRSQPVRENQVFSREAPAAVSEMFAKAGAAAGVGLEQNSVLGTRFGGYAQLLMQRVAEHWNTGGMQGLRVPATMVGVTIFRNGSIQNARVTQSSGNYAVDMSALRAVMQAAPFPPLPPEYGGASADVEFRFVLQR